MTDWLERQAKDLAFGEYVARKRDAGLTWKTIRADPEAKRLFRATYAEYGYQWDPSHSSVQSAYARYCAHTGKQSKGPVKQDRDIMAEAITHLLGDGWDEYKVAQAFGINISGEAMESARHEMQRRNHSAPRSLRKSNSGL